MQVESVIAREITKGGQPWQLRDKTDRPLGGVAGDCQPAKAVAVRINPY